MSNIVSGYIRFLDHEDASLSGEALECQANDQGFCPRPEYVHGKVSQRSTTVWDPLFKMYHGENSELPDAIP